MASKVLASAPLAGALGLAAGCRVGHEGGLMQRVSFEPVQSYVKSGIQIRPANTCKVGHGAKLSKRFGVRASAETDVKTIEGVVFEPFTEVQSLLSQLPSSPHESLARQRFPVSCESAINEHINVEYNASYIYHGLFAYFDRDDIALPGLAKYFKEQSEEEREHAEWFMQYQNKRGGRVKLLSIVLPQMEFANDVKGDALYAMKFSLSLEKLVTEKLYGLHKVAEEAKDIHLAQKIRSEWLTEQIESIKKISEFVAQLRRIGQDGHGVYYWDQVLLEEDGA